MKTSVWLFVGLAIFFAVDSILYTAWGFFYLGEIDWSGGTPFGLATLLSALIAFFLWRSHRSQGGELPQDRPAAGVDDDDPEQGFFSPWSWWPMLLSLGVGLVFLGVAVAFWLAIIGAAFSVICLVGWVYEYYRGYFAR
jgi:hypothetical protein